MSRPSRRPSTRLLGAALAATLAVAATTAVAQKSNSENNPRLGPTADLGKFVGHPAPTYQWHGCSMTARADTTATRPEGMPAFDRGTRPAAVRFIRTADPERLMWTAKPGWQICGVQMVAALKNSTVPYRYAASFGYRSSRTKGSTHPSGREVVRVKIPRNVAHSGIGPELRGKVFTVDTVYDVTVFVKRAGRR